MGRRTNTHCVGGTLGTDLAFVSPTIFPPSEVFLLGLSNKLVIGTGMMYDVVVSIGTECHHVVSRAFYSGSVRDHRWWWRCNITLQQTITTEVVGERGGWTGNMTNDKSSTTPKTRPIKKLVRLSGSLAIYV